MNGAVRVSSPRPSSSPRRSPRARFRRPPGRSPRITDAREVDFLRRDGRVPEDRRRKGPVVVSVEGKTARGRSLFLVHASHGGTLPSGSSSTRSSTATRSRARTLSSISCATSCATVAPSEGRRPLGDADGEPDGAEAGTRKNSAGADLNRDHVTLFQPETEALHRVARRVKPHLAVDAHEFGRDSRSGRRRDGRSGPTSRWTG